MSREDMDGALDERDDDELHSDAGLDDGDDRHEAGDADEAARAGEAPEDDDEDADTRRERRRKERAERKARQRETRDRQEALIAALSRHNRELEARLATIEQRATGHETAQIDRAIAETQAAMTNAKAYMAKAVAEGNGEEVAKATDYYADARERLRQLEALKKDAARPARPAVDPDAGRYSQQWMSKNQWFDPSLADTDSKIARMIDLEVHRDGFHPGTEVYWNELDRRLKERLPHRYAGAAGRRSAAADDDDDDPPPQRRRSPVGGSGRDRPSGNGSEYVLSPDRVRALKEANMWDDPVARKRAIDRYREYDRQHGRSR